MTLKKVLFTFIQSAAISILIFTLIAFSFLNISNPSHTLKNKDNNSTFITYNDIVDDFKENNNQ